MLKLIIAVLAVADATAGAVLAWQEWDRQSTDHSSTQSPGAVQPTADGQFQTPTPTPHPAGSTTVPKESVDFDLLVEQTKPPETSVLFRVTIRVFLDARLTNRGNLDAHDVRVETRARLGQDYITIDGEDSGPWAWGPSPAARQ